VINCVRDGRAIVEAWERAWGMYDPAAWMNSIIQTSMLPWAIVAEVRYEELLGEPDEVQDMLGQIIKGLNKVADFSDYPEFVPEESFVTEDERYVPRPIDDSGLNAPTPLNYERRPNDIEYFETLLQELNYL